MTSPSKLNKRAKRSELAVDDDDSEGYQDSGDLLSNFTTRRVSTRENKGKASDFNKQMGFHSFQEVDEDPGYEKISYETSGAKISKKRQKLSMAPASDYSGKTKQGGSQSGHKGLQTGQKHSASQSSQNVSQDGLGQGGAQADRSGTQIGEAASEKPTSEDQKAGDTFQADILVANSALPDSVDLNEKENVGAVIAALETGNKTLQLARDTILRLAAVSASWDQELLARVSELEKENHQLKRVVDVQEEVLRSAQTLVDKLHWMSVGSGAPGGEVVDNLRQSLRDAAMGGPEACEHNL